MLVACCQFAADLGSAVAANERGDYKTAYVEYKPLAEHGNAQQAQFNPGTMYSYDEGIPENDAETVKWYRLAAEHRNAEGQLILGDMYRDGGGVPHDYIPECPINQPLCVEYCTCFIAKMD